MTIRVRVVHWPAAIGGERSVGESAWRNTVVLEFGVRQGQVEILASRNAGSGSHFRGTSVARFVDLGVVSDQRGAAEVIGAAFGNQHSGSIEEFDIHPHAAPLWITARQFVTALVGDAHFQFAALLRQCQVACVTEHLHSPCLGILNALWREPQ